MEIYLVRHTTPEIEKGICYGQSDLEVSNSFKTEVKKIHDQVPINKISKVYSSPLKRCKLLANTFKKEIVLDHRLKELNFGDWELKTWDAINQKDLNLWMKDFVTVQVPNGESYLMLQKRVLEFFTSLDHASDQKVLISSHASPIRVILSYIQNIALEDSFNIKIKYGQVVTIETKQDSFKITKGLNLQ